MGVSSKELHYQLKSKLNRFNRNYSEEIPVHQADRALTEAYFYWYESNAQIAEVNDTARRNLKDFEIKDEPMDVEFNGRRYIGKFPENFYKYLRLSCIAFKEGCGEKELTVNVEPSKKINKLLKNPYWEPSYEYEETFADEFKDGLIVYHKGFEVRRVYMDYLEKPLSIQTPSLTRNGEIVNADGEKITADRGIPLTSSLESRKIVDIAALIVMRDKGDIRDYESQLNKISIINN